MLFRPVSGDQKEYIFNDAKKKIGISNFQRFICSVCDCSWPRNQIREVSLTEKKAQKWRMKIRPHGDTPQALQSFYDVSSMLPQLHGMMLSRKGVQLNSTAMPTGCIYVCFSCEKSLSRPSLNPPKFSIANGFAIGELPARFHEATIVEKRLSSITSLAVPLTVLRGGKHSVLRGHTFVVTIDPTVLTRSLPELLPDGSHNYCSYCRRTYYSAEDCGNETIFLQSSNYSGSS